MKLRKGFSCFLGACAVVVLGGGLSFGQRLEQDIQAHIWKSPAGLFKFSLYNSSLTVARYATSTRTLQASQTFSGCHGLAGRPNALECKIAYVVKDWGRGLTREAPARCQEMNRSNTGWCDPYTGISTRSTTRTTTIYKNFVIESANGKMILWFQNQDNDSYSMVECFPE